MIHIFVEIVLYEHMFYNINIYKGGFFIGYIKAAREISAKSR
jgi:hypothetical protein